MSVVFHPELCDLNPFCPVASACPTGALRVDRKTFRPTFDAEKCAACGTCVEECPKGALKEV